MARNGTWIALALAFAGLAGGDEAAVKRWDEPQRESFALTDAPPERIAAELRGRYGVPFEADVSGLPPLDFEATGVTFFEAIDRLASARNLVVAGWPQGVGENRLRLVRVSRSLPSTPVAYVGPTRLSVQRISALNEADWTPDEDKRDWKEFVAGLPPEVRSALGRDEPRLRITFDWTAEPGCEEAALVAWEVHGAEAGGAIDMQGPPKLPLQANDSFAVDFAVPSRKVRHIAKLEGRIRVALPLRDDQVEFRAAEQGQSKVLGRAKAKLEDIDESRKIVRFTIDGAPCDSLDARNSSRAIRVGSKGAADGRAPLLTVFAYGAGGAEIAGTFKRTWSDVGSPLKTYWIELDEAPARIVLRATVAVAFREAPFAFKDIPLPE